MTLRPRTSIRKCLRSPRWFRPLALNCPRSGERSFETVCQEYSLCNPEKDGWAMNVSRNLTSVRRQKKKFALK